MINFENVLLIISKTTKNNYVKVVDMKNEFISSILLFNWVIGIKSRYQYSILTKSGQFNKI